MAWKPNIQGLRKRKNVKKLVRILTQDDEYHRRYEAARALGAIGDPAAVEALVKALDDTFWEVRGYAADALGEIRDPRAVEPLIAALKDDEGKRAKRWDLVYGAVYETNDARPRRGAATALGMIGDKKAIPALYEALKDRYLYVRTDALKSLEKLGARPDTEQLLQICFGIMADREERVRCDAAEQMLETDGAQGFRLLIKALQGENRNRFNAAAWTLVYSSRMGQIRKEDLNLAVKETMESMVAKVSQAEVQPGIDSLDEVMRRLLQVLEKYGDASVLPALDQLLERLTEKRRAEGFRREYVQTQEYGGWMDNDADIKWVQRVIDEIKKRSAA